MHRGRTRSVEVRRHSMRCKPGAHLTSEGISLARFASRTMGTFDRVITSDLPRAVETAIAMGYRVDSRIEELGVISNEPVKATGWPQSTSRIAENAQRSWGLRSFAERQADLWRNALDDLGDGERRVLIISHGAIMELGLLAAAEWSAAEHFGDVFGYCEGFRLRYDGQRCISAKLLRIPESRRLVEN